MDRAAKHLGLLAVFGTGLIAAVYGFVRLVLVQDLDVASAEAAGGLSLLAWVIFHPARAPENVRAGR
jgi:hypothetical protein